VIDIEGIIAEIFASLKVCSSNQPVGRINGTQICLALLQGVTVAKPITPNKGVHRIARKRRLPPGDARRCVTNEGAK